MSHLDQYLAGFGKKQLGCIHVGFSLICDQSVECKACFRVSNTTLPKPLKPPEDHDVTELIQVRRELFGHKIRLRIPTSKDRMAFKNISLYITDLPPTPKRFRDKYTRTYSPENARKSRSPAPGPLSDRDKLKRAKLVSDLHHAGYASSAGTSPPQHLRSQIDHPQTYQMGYIPRIPLSVHPGTYGFEMFSSISTRARPTTQMESSKRGNYPGTAHSRMGASEQTFVFRSPYDKIMSQSIERERSQLFLNPSNLLQLIELDRYFIRPM